MNGRKARALRMIAQARETVTGRAYVIVKQTRQILCKPGTWRSIHQAMKKGVAA